MPSDVRVFVHFKDQCVFAGEELHCTITFKNVADIPEPSTPVTPALGHRRRTSYGFPAEGYKHTAGNASVNRQVSASGTTSHGVSNSGNRLRTMIPSEGSQPQNGMSRISTADKSSEHHKPTHRHRGSVSIISGAPTPSLQGGSNPQRAPSMAIGHRRSSTVQGASGTMTSSVVPDRSFAGSHRPDPYGPRRSPLSTTTVSQFFTDSQGPARTSASVVARRRGVSISNHDKQDMAVRPLPRQTRDIEQRLLSDANVDGSVRTSGDFYSLSNHSQETIMSEQPSIISEMPYLSTNNMRPAHLPASNRRPQTVKMLMGYAHVTANFTLDGSLVNQTPFEEVKEKGFLGGQRGGGVVGASKTKRTSGLLSGFSLDSIGESLSGMLSSNNLSSVKEMKATANSRAIPLLSTPQSLLFVNLTLDPGEEKKFTFAYKLPRGLPSGFRGKAIRINYNLTIGIQRSSASREGQSMKHINIPIRLFSGVSREGEILGHDLMQPHVVLQDLARVKQVDPSESEDQPDPAKSPQSADSSKQEFLKFVDTLLDRHKRRLSSTMTSDGTFHAPESDVSSPSIQAINRAIMLSNQSDSPSNRFEIAHNGLRVAVVVLDRALHRLGETITCVVDFSDSRVQCASLRASLETSEKVTPSLAVRSAATIARVTKRVYATHAENVLFAKRVTFCPSIPSSATPSFMTSGVSLEWGLNIQFGTVLSTVEMDGRGNETSTDSGTGNGSGVAEPVEPLLLEEIGNDEKGVVCVATEVLQCETLEVVIPITVYGDIVPDGGEDEDVVGRPI